MPQATVMKNIGMMLAHVPPNAWPMTPLFTHSGHGPHTSASVKMPPPMNRPRNTPTADNSRMAPKIG